MDETYINNIKNKINTSNVKAMLPKHALIDYINTLVKGIDMIEHNNIPNIMDTHAMEAIMDIDRDVVNKFSDPDDCESQSGFLKRCITSVIQIIDMNVSEGGIDYPKYTSKRNITTLTHNVVWAVTTIL